MLTIAYATVCLACAGLARRVQHTRESIPTASDEAHPNVALSSPLPLRELATSLLSADDPAAGWKVSAHGRRSALRKVGRTPAPLMRQAALGFGSSNVTRQQPDWRQTLASIGLGLAAGAALLGGNPQGAFAENELASLATQKSFSDIVNPSCFATSCKSEMETCAAEGDCIKGLTCSAKCMGDAGCAMGCFARYGNPALDRVLQCTIEDNDCIQIATQERGADTPFNAPLPPKALVKATPASMSGKWYKVLGFNPNYDCFECQKNTFTSGPNAKRLLDVNSIEVGPQSAVVEVEYTMPRERLGQPPSTFHSKLVEKLEFDDQAGSRRTAHTEGRMFGLTFYENWYLIGKNKNKEPEFRFVYYNGKTLQNRYEGAFVYARKPELPQAAMPSIYKMAREAGYDPTRACCIDNSCFANAEQPIQPPLFTPVAYAAEPVMPETRAAPKEDPLLEFLNRNQLFRDTSKLATDVAEMLEDPKPAGKAIHARQRPMSELREYDPNGYRMPSASYAPKF